MKAATIFEKAKKANIFDENESKVEMKGVETSSVQLEFATFFTNVATMKVNLGAVKESQNEIRAEPSDLKALQTVISKNLDDIIFRQEDMLIQHEAAIKQHTKYIGRLVVCAGNIEQIIKSLQQSQPQSKSRESNYTPAPLRQPAEEATFGSHQIAKSAKFTPAKVVKPSQVQHVYLKWRVIKLKYLEDYTDPCKKHRKVTDVVKADPNEPINPKAKKALDKWLTKPINKSKLVDVELGDFEAGLFLTLKNTKPLLDSKQIFKQYIIARKLLR